MEKCLTKNRFDEERIEVPDLDPSRHWSGEVRLWFNNLLVAIIRSCLFYHWILAMKATPYSSTVGEPSGNG